ncbi:hypothetical protein [Ehrlichia muris]|nr:hypothetical protein [Ehrlichia muris]
MIYNAISGTVENSNVTTISSTMLSTNGSSILNHRDNKIQTVIVVGLLLLTMLLVLAYCVLHYRDAGARRRNVLRYLQIYGPRPDVPNVIMELDVIHNAQSRENQNQCVESSPFICNHGGQENGDTGCNHQVRPVFRLQGMFPR